MGKLYLLISALLLTVSATFAAAPDSYEWWFDHDVSSAQKGSLSGKALDLEIDTSDLPEGIHYFNLRLSEGDSIYGSVYRRMFHSLGKDNGAISYEYWFDYDYNSKVVGTIEMGSNHLELDISNLPPGAHYYNIRLGYGDGSRGSVYRKMVLNLAGSVDAVAYEYWIDNNYETKTSGSIAPGANSYEIDLTGVSRGLHRFNYRLMTGEGIWGATFTSYFYSESNAARFSEYEYWLDNDYANRVTVNATGNPTSFEVDLSAFDKSGGAHYFNLRARDGDSDWGPIYRKSIRFLDDAKAIIGYRHYVNDIDLGYVPLETPSDSICRFDVQIPDRALLSSSHVDSIGNATDSVRYVVQLKTELGWAPPVYWDMYLPKLISGSVKIKYNGRYLTMECDDKESDIKYWFDDEDSYSIHLYADTLDVKGIHHVKAFSSKNGYLDSDVAEFNVDHYADEEHAETSAGGLLESAFAWSGSDLPNSVENFRVEGTLNDADYRFLNSMRSLRHLDIEKVADAHIPDYAFRNSKLISISLPSDISEYGDSIFSGASCLSSVLWNSKTLAMEEKLTDGLVNPNVLLYMPGNISFNNKHDLNIISNGKASSILLHYGYPYYAAWDLRADRVSMTREFCQETEIDVCRGWETIVLPFSPETITHEAHGEATPFAAWDGNTEGKKPFWLYGSTETGWKEASEIEAGVPYIISMPNNPDYVYSSNLAGGITFAASGVDLGPESSLAIATQWKEGTDFEGTFMPVEAEGILTLNVADASGDYLPGSTFVANGSAAPFSAYVIASNGKKAMPVFGDMSGVNLPTMTGGGLAIETPAPGILKISSGRERKVTVTTATGVTIRTLHLKAGESVTLEGLTRDLYIVAGVKVMVK